MKNRLNSIRFTCYSLFILFALVASCTPTGSITQNNDVILINHLGYSINAPKHLVVQSQSGSKPDGFKVETSAGEIVYEGTFEDGGLTDNWHTGKAYSAYFSELIKEGDYYIVIEKDGKSTKSELFEIKDQILAETTLHFLVEGIKSQRVVDPYNEKDKTMTFVGLRKDTVDVSGGWYDASGDRSKYLSHLSYANYMNPQQAPMLVWNFVDSYKNLEKYKGHDAEALKMSVLAEATHGANWLVRMQDREGYFYMNVFDVWSWDVNKREICSYKGIEGIKNENYQCGYREGGGVAIAALARMASEKIIGEYDAKRFLEAAIKGFDHLEQNNLRYIDNGEENIIDDYCALLAATELFMATNNQIYLTAARKRVKNLINRIEDDDVIKGYWRADTKNERPFYHGSDAGLPLVSLVRFLEVEVDPVYRDEVIAAIRKSVDFELNITSEVTNPFGYARQYVKSTDETTKRTAFFLAQKNESGYWWQGENARLGSLATAIFKSVPYLDEARVKPALSYANNQINWILGLNPFNMTMLHGKGRNNPSYNPEYGGGSELNALGCVCNGITGGFGDEHDIAFMPKPYGDDVSNKWRWAEQWQPHGSWLLAAISASL